MGVPLFLHYVASKGAVFALTRALARQARFRSSCIIELDLSRFTVVLPHCDGRWGGISTTPIPRFVLIECLEDIRDASRCHKGPVKVL